MSPGVRLGEGLDFLMQLTPNRQELAARLAPLKQEHLLRFWDELDEAGRKNLATQIAAIDVEQIALLFHQGAGSQDWAAMSRRAKPAPAVRLADRQKGKPWTLVQARKRGVEALAAGEIGVLLVAGGQGSRLGFDHPKGMYSIGPVSGASLLQIHFEKAVATAQRYGAPVPIYMMTSPVTHDEQAQYLEEHDRFGLPADDVVLFCQGTMPAVDAKRASCCWPTRARYS